MAVYKPTQCYPYLTAVDMRVGADPVYFTCKVNTSNKNITGYQVILLDGNNNQIFPKPPSDDNSTPHKISPLSELLDITIDANVNTGVNDTYIQVPLIQAFDEMCLLSYNCIYYRSATDTWIDCNNNTIDIKNNGMTYKWKIMLYQGTNGVMVYDSTEPRYSDYSNIDASEYDLVISSGTVCGTTPSRLQIEPTDEVLVQKWVQLAYSSGSGYEAVGARGNIKSYDATLGHIYPVSDWMDAKILNSNRATYCCVYKHSNSEDDIPTTDIVKYAFLGQLFNGGEPSGLSTTESWTPEGASQPISTSVVFEKGDLVLLTSQSNAKYNGVWVADSTTWGRSGNFKDWAAYLGRIIYASSAKLGGSTTATAGRNYMSQASYGGTLYTPLMQNLSASSSLYFTEEQPIVLYPKDLTETVQYRMTTSGTPSGTTIDGYTVETGDIILASNGIYQRSSSSWVKIADLDPNGKYYVMQGEKGGCKTYKGWSTVTYDLCYSPLSYNTPSQTYIGQNVNLEVGQRLFFTNVDGVLLANGQTQPYITINTIDKDMWCITHETLAAALPSVDPYTYNIQTYFNTSDETAFYAYDAPSLSLNIESTASTDLVSTSVDGGINYLAELPNYSSQLIDGTQVDNNTVALGIGDEGLGTYTASLSALDDNSSTPIPSVDYLYSSGNQLQTMPYIIDALDVLGTFEALSNTVDGYTYQDGDYIYTANAGGYRIDYVIDATKTANPWFSTVKTFSFGEQIFLYVKHGNTYGNNFWSGKATLPSQWSVTSLVLDGSNFATLPNNATFYAYYLGSYSTESTPVSAGVVKYAKNTVDGIPFSIVSTSGPTTPIAIKYGLSYANKIVTISGKTISLASQDTNVSFAITWTKIESFDPAAAFFIKQGQMFGGRTVTIGDQNGRKYIQDGLITVSEDNIQEITVSTKDGQFTVPVLYTGIIHTRFISLVGTYSQPQAASWMSYRWMLVDQNGDVIQDTGKQFSGLMNVVFYGLMENQRYYAILVVEDQLGNSLMSCAQIDAMFTPQDLEIDFKARYDCNIHGVVLSLQDMGYILPYDQDVGAVATAYTPQDASLAYSQGKMRVSGSNGSMFANVGGDANEKGVKYKYYFGYNEEITPITSQLYTEDDGTTSFRMVTRLDANYRGRIVRFMIETPESSRGKYLAIDLIAPDDFSDATDRVLDYDSPNLSANTLNSTRNQLVCTIGSVSNIDSEIAAPLAEEVPLYTCWPDSGTNGYDKKTAPNVHYYRQFNAQLDVNGDWVNTNYQHEYLNANKIKIGNVYYQPIDSDYNGMRPVNPCCLVLDPMDTQHNGDSIWEDWEVDLISDEFPIQRAEYGRVTKLTNNDPIPYIWKDSDSATTPDIVDNIPYNFRSSPANIGSVMYDKIIGGTIAWNQQYNITNTTAETVSGVTFSKNNGALSASGTASAQIYKRLQINIPTVNGHKMLVVCSPSEISGVSLYDDNSPQQFAGARTAKIFTASGANIRFYLLISNGTEVNFTIYPQLFDLTAMFGSAIADYIASLETANAGAGVAWFKELLCHGTAPRYRPQGRCDRNTSSV